MKGYYGEFESMPEEYSTYRKGNEQAHERGDLTDEQFEELHPTPMKSSLPF